MTTDNNKEIEEIVDELINQIYDYEDTRGNVKIKITEALTSYADQRVKEERDRVLKILKEHDKSIESRVLEVVYPPKVVYTPDFSVEIKNLTEEE